MPNRILILGGSGFIGSHLIEKFSLRNQVICFSRTEPKNLRQNNNLRWIKGDFTQKESLSQVLTGVNAVIHCICGRIPATSQNTPTSAIYEDLLPTINLVEEMKRQSVNQLLFLSSGGTIYGNTMSQANQRLDEKSPLSPISYYGALKAASEHFLTSSARNNDLNCTIIRPSNVYGLNTRWKNQLGFIHSLVDNHLNNIPTNIFGNGEIIRDYLYISDLVELIYTAVIHPKPGIYNAGSGLGYSLNQIVNIVAKITDKTPQISHLETRDCDVKQVVLNSSLAKNCFNWRPKVNLEAGIRQLIDQKRG